MKFSEAVDQNIWMIIQAISLTALIVWAAAFLRKDVNDNTEWNKRQDTKIEMHEERARETYVRKDIAQQRYENLIEKLDRLIDDRNR